MALLSDEIMQRLRDNRNADEPPPVVRLYNPYGKESYLLIAQDDSDANKFLCIADIGYGPDRGYVTMRQLEDMDNRGIPLVYDEDETFEHPWTAYL